MAQPTTARFGKMRISLQDPDNPNLYVAPCGLTSKGLSLNKGLSEESIPDCDDPDAPLWLARDVQNLSMSITGNGLLAAESEDVWVSAAMSTEPVKALVEVEFSTGTRTFEGDFQVDTFSISGENGGRITSEISLQSDGIINTDWTLAS